MKIGKGLYEIAFDIKQKEINKVISKYRKLHPEDKRNDSELRPFAINQVMRDRCKSGNT